ncbi:MAG: hypothetical protein ABJA66_09010 [Actinomycetota bacterium]
MTARKGLAIAELSGDWRVNNRMVRALAVDDSAVGEPFRRSSGSSDQSLLAAARSLLTSAAPLKDRFVEYSFPNDFLEDLQVDITDFEQPVSEKSTASGVKASATVSIGVALKIGLEVRRCRGAVHPEQIPRQPRQTRHLDKCRPSRTRGKEEKNRNTIAIAAMD